jgi:hypothetical protein
VAAIGLVLCPGRNKTVTQWALRGLDTPVALARYTTGDTTMTDETATAPRPALPELPELTAELAGITEAANAPPRDILQRPAFCGPLAMPEEGLEPPTRGL